jgi:hypothetical protein
MRIYRVLFYISIAVLSAAMLHYLSEYLFLNYTVYLSDHDSFVYHEKLRKIQSGELAKTRILLLGDSQIMSAVSADILSRELGGAAVWNGGLPAMEPEGIELMLPSILTSMPELDLIIFNIGPYSVLENDNVQAFHKYYREVLLWYHPDIYKILTSGNTQIFVTDNPLIKTGTLTSFYFNPVSEMTVPPEILIRYPVLTSAADVKEMTELKRWDPVMRMRNQIDKNKVLSGMLQSENGRWTWNSFDNYRMNCGNTVKAIDLPVKTFFKKRQEAAESWQRIFHLLNKEKKEFIVIGIPLSSAWEKKADSQAVQNLMRNAESEFRREIPGLNYEYNIQSSEDAENGFFDITHLSRCGADRFTMQLSERIRNLKKNH